MNQRVIKFKIQFHSSNYRIPYGKDSTGLRNCQVELRFSTCACVYKLEKDVPSSLTDDVKRNIKLDDLDPFNP